MARAESFIEIRRPASAVFAALDDFARAPEWLQSCKSLRQLSPGVRAAGARLRYAYEMAYGAGEMDGTLTAYEPDALIAMQFEDTRFGVTVEFRLEPTEAGTRVVHGIDLALKVDLPRFMEALVLAENRKQVGNNLSQLKRRIEAAIPPADIDDSTGGAHGP